METSPTIVTKCGRRRLDFVLLGNRHSRARMISDSPLAHRRGGSSHAVNFGTDGQSGSLCDSAQGSKSAADRHSRHAGSAITAAI